METHHIIPLSAQRYYKNKLDCTANLSCLCPTCHRSIHYGKKEDKLPLLKQIYEKHIDDIIKSGIEIESLESVLLYY
ncbi:HNH endonuclease [Enterococcus faecalis]